MKVLLNFWIFCIKLLSKQILKFYPTRALVLSKMTYKSIWWKKSKGEKTAIREAKLTTFERVFIKKILYLQYMPSALAILLFINSLILELPFSMVAVIHIMPFFKTKKKKKKKSKIYFVRFKRFECNNFCSFMFFSFYTWCSKFLLLNWHTNLRFHFFFSVCGSDLNSTVHYPCYKKLIH